MDPAGFKPPDWSFLTPGLAHWFLTAIDEGVVQVTSDSVFMRGSSHSEGIFEHGLMATSPRQSKLRVESFFEIAAVGMLAVRFGWPVERLRFQSPDGAFDLSLMSMMIGTGPRSRPPERRSSCREAVKLSASLKVCGERGEHPEADCTELENQHRKYLGLLKYRPRIFWIVGPEAFTAADPDLVLRAEENGGGIVRLHRIDASGLASSSP